jgi:hypothetical protein
MQTNTPVYGNVMKEVKNIPFKGKVCMMLTNTFLEIVIYIGHFKRNLIILGRHLSFTEK